jgi:hypothetical protein
VATFTCVSCPIFFLLLINSWISTYDSKQGFRNKLYYLHLLATHPYVWIHVKYVFANGISGAARSTPVHTFIIYYNDAVLLTHGVLWLCVSINVKTSVITLFSLLQNFQNVIVMIEPSESTSTSVPCKPAHSRLSSSGSVCRICHEGAQFGYYPLFPCTLSFFFISVQVIHFVDYLGIFSLSYLEYMELLNRIYPL